MKKPLAILFFVIIFFSISTCYALTDTATVSWQANDATDLAGYKVYHGTSASSYGQVEFVGITTSYTFDDLQEGETHYFVVTAVDTSGNESGYSAEVSKIIPNTPLPAAPVIDSIIPSSGGSLVMVPQIFETIYSDANGVDDIKLIKLLINKKVSSRRSIYVYYNMATNKLYLRNDSGKKWLGGYAPGTSRMISNKQCELDCSLTTIEKNGNTIRVNWHITPASAFTGEKQLFLFAKDMGNKSSGWIDKGSYTINAQN